MPKDSRPKKGKTIKGGHRDDRIKESSGKYVTNSGRKPYKNTIKHDSKSDKSDEFFQEK